MSSEDDVPPQVSEVAPQGEVGEQQHQARAAEEESKAEDVQAPSTAVPPASATAVDANDAFSLDDVFAPPAPASAAGAGEGAEDADELERLALEALLEGEQGNATAERKKKRKRTEGGAKAKGDKSQKARGEATRKAKAAATTESTEELERKATFRQAQHTLRKNASSVNLTEALSRSMAPGSQAGAEEGVSQSASVSVVDVTNTFLSKITASKNDKIDMLFRKETTRSKMAATQQQQQPLFHSELDAGDMVLELDEGNANLGAPQDEVDADTEMLIGRPNKQRQPAEESANESSSGDESVDDEKTAVLRRKHEIMRLHRHTSSQQQSQTLIAKHTSPLLSSMQAAADSKKVAAAPRQSFHRPHRNVALTQKMSSMFQHVSETDAAALKRNNSFDNSASSEPVVFKKTAS